MQFAIFFSLILVVSTGSGAPAAFLKVPAVCVGMPTACFESARSCLEGILGSTCSGFGVHTQRVSGEDRSLQCISGIFHHFLGSSVYVFGGPRSLFRDRHMFSWLRAAYFGVIPAKFQRDASNFGNRMVSSHKSSNF